MKDIAIVERGNGLQKSDFTESGTPCIHYGQIYTKFNTHTSKVLTYVPENVSNKLKKVNPGNIIMAVTSENIEDVCKCVAWVGNEPIVTGGHTAIIRSKENAKYLAYWFQTYDFFAQKVKLAHGTKVIEVTPADLNDIQILLPSKSVQDEIVRKLENFHNYITDLSEGLPAEIEARKKQYEYYRDMLLSFS